MGLAVGVAAGLAAGLLTAPMRGTDMRASLRSRAAEGGARLHTLASSGREWAQNARHRGMTVIDDGRRAFDPRNVGSAPAVAPSALTASIGEIAQLHGTEDINTLEDRR